MTVKATLQFASTDEWPRNRVVSTARRGFKYAGLVPGDTVHLEHIGGETHIGDAVVVVKEQATLNDVLDNSDHNHVIVARGLEKDIYAASRVLRRDLESCYGSLIPEEPFTILHLLLINQ